MEAWDVWSRLNTLEVTLKVMGGRHVPSAVTISVPSSGRAGRNTARARTCLSGRKDARFPDLEQGQGCVAAISQICNEYGSFPSQYPKRESKWYLKGINISIYISLPWVEFSGVINALMVWRLGEASPECLRPGGKELLLFAVKVPKCVSLMCLLIQAWGFWRSRDALGKEP